MAATDRMQFLADPRAWFVDGHRLKRAADLVGSEFEAEVGQFFKTMGVTEDSPDTVERRLRAVELALPAYMLIGYAIEVIVKWLIAARGDEEAIKWMATEHLDLPLIDRAQVSLKQGERSLVKHQLFHAVRWSGRYPAPSQRVEKRLQQDEIAAARGSIFSDPVAVSPDHYRQTCELFDRLQAELSEEIAAARRQRLTNSTPGADPRADLNG